MAHFACLFMYEYSSGTLLLLSLCLSHASIFFFSYLPSLVYSIQYATALKKLAVKNVRLGFTEI